MKKMTEENVKAALAFKPLHVCSTCGFTVEGDAPDTCPVCGAAKAKFVTF
jgi:rubrerythrin